MANITDLNFDQNKLYWYKYNIPNGWIPIYVYDIGMSSSEFWSKNYGYDYIRLNNAVVKDIQIPIWGININGYQRYRKIPYSDKFVTVDLAYQNKPITNEEGGEIKCVFSDPDNPDFKWTSWGAIRWGGTQYYQNTFASVFVFAFHTTDDRYYKGFPYSWGGAGAPIDGNVYNSNLTNFTSPGEDKKGVGIYNGSFWYLGNLLVGSGIASNAEEITSLFKKITKGISPYDPDEPNPGGGNSTGGGGGGESSIGGDTNDDDGLPTISALDSGLLTAYNPTEAELQSLGHFLWSDSFDVNSFKKLFNDPFDTLLGLSVIPIAPKTSGNKNIMFGNLDSGVSSPVVSSQWVSKDMGTLQLNEVWKGALDYSPSTAVSVYLPFIGMRQLNVNDVMGSSLHLIYKFDVLTGTCIAQIYVNHNAQGNKDSGGFSYTKNQGLIYEFMGQCSVNIPLASQDFTNTIRAAISAVGMVSGAAASIATGNPALGIASLAVSAANSGMQANTPTVERSGHLSGSGALLGYYQPFLVVERPHQCKPQRYYALRGIPSQVYTAKLAECTGFTQITDNNNIHASGAQDTELEELERLLSSGVYFPDKKRS